MFSSANDSRLGQRLTASAKRFALAGLLVGLNAIPTKPTFAQSFPSRAPFAFAVPEAPVAGRGEVRLGDVSIRAQQGQGEALAREVEAAITARRRIAREEDSAHVVVFFAAPPTPALRAVLAKSGVRLQMKISASSWSASATASGIRGLSRTKGVVGAALIPAQAKLSSMISEAESLTYLKRKGGYAYTIVFHEDVGFAEALAVIERNGGKVEKPNRTAYEGFPSLTAVLPQKAVGSVAAYDAVRGVETGPSPRKDLNRNNTQPLSNVDDVQVAPYNLSGAGITVGIWENGDIVRATHQEVTPRVTVQPGQTTSQDGHALHVAGTIGASGVNSPNAEGMAPAVTILSWDDGNDVAEMRAASNLPSPAIVASNHSYGDIIGWNGANFGNDQAQFGQYTARTQSIDDVVADNGLVVIKAAGNDRNDGDPNPVFPPNGPNDCTQNAYPGGVLGDCIGPFGVAKNVITVGAMNGAAAIAPFSSFGPTDDGRIKPDLVAHGVNVTSLGAFAMGTDDGPQDDTSTWVTSGTSMATPAVTGIVALMFEEAQNLGIALDADSVKALLIQTARDVTGVGQAQPGPDFATGWGIADAQAAIDLMRQPGGPGLAQDTIAATGAAGAYVLPFYVHAGQPEMHVTLAWTDPQGNSGLPANAAQLVNDLDLRLIEPDGTTVHQPWTLNATNPGLAAVRNGGDDAVNPVEQVSVLSPAEGIWYAQVTAKSGSLVAGAQDFALAGPFLPQDGPIASNKRNLMLVLDRSGSMNLPSSVAGVSKLEAMRNAATAFTDFIEIVGGHNLGIVQFNESVVTPTMPFDLQPLDDTTVAAARSTIADVSAGGLTNIIAGVTAAETAFGSAAATNPSSAILLFSDGQHNRPTGSDVATIDTLMADATEFYGIGFGTDVDSSVMPTVADNHNGLWVEEQTLNGAELSKLFLLAAGLAVNETIVVDPDYVIAPGATIQQNAMVIPQDRSLTFAVTWNGPEASDLAFALNGPIACAIGDQDHPGYQSRSGAGYKLIRVELPYACQGTGSSLHDGMWSLQVANQGSDMARLKIMALADSAIELFLVGRIEEGFAVVEAKLLDSGGPMTLQDGNAVAYVPHRLPQTDDSEDDDAIGSTFDQPVPGQGSGLSLQYDLIELNDEGVDGDQIAGDGIFGGRVPYDPSTGMQQIRVVVEGELAGHSIRREAITSVATP